MARPLRVQFPGAHYHIINRGLERRFIFLGDADHHRFVELLQDIHDRWQVEILAYCCMTTHYHLFVHTPMGNISRIMRHLDGVYTQRFNRHHGRDGPLFRGRYKALLVDTDAYLLQVVRYIHLNPVDAGLTTDPRTYPWGSHRLYCQVQAPTWLGRDRVLSFFRDRSAFAQFIAEGNEASLLAFYERKRWSPFLGNDRFVQRALQPARMSGEHPRQEKTPQFPNIEAVVRFICVRTGASVESLRANQPGHRNLPRSLAIYLASRVAGFPYREICEYFHLGTCGAVTRVCQRTERLLLQDARLRQLIRQDGAP